MEVPENLTQAMMDNAKEKEGSNDKENNSPNEADSKKIKFMMSGVSDDERNRLIKELKVS